VISYGLTRDGVQLEKKDVVFVDGGFGWVVTLTVPAGQRAAFDPIFDAFIGSFELLGRSSPAAGPSRLSLPAPRRTGPIRDGPASQGDSHIRRACPRRQHQAGPFLLTFVKLPRKQPPHEERGEEAEERYKGKMIAAITTYTKP